MLKNTMIVRMLCFIAFAGLLLVTEARAQDTAPGVRLITLDDAQAQAAASAMKNLARLTIDAAKYHRQAVQADYFPKVDASFLNLHYNKFLGQQIQLFRRDAELPLFGKDETAVLLTVIQPVTQLLQVRQAVNVARADEEIAKAKAAGMTSQIAMNVEHAYFALLIAQRQQTVAETKVKMLESGSQLASTIAMPAGNMMEHKTALLEASKELATADNEVTELTHSLNALIGFTPDTKLVLLPPEPVTETVSLPQATQQAVANSPEIIEAKETVVKAKAASKLAKLEYVPAVTIVGGYINQPQPVLPLLPQDFSFIGFTATYTIFDFGKRERTVSERNTQVSMAEANVALVQAKVAAGVQKAFMDLERTRKIRDLTRRLAVSYQEISLNNTAARATAEAEMFQAEMDYRSAYTQLKRIIDGR
ncbi:MAG TPA: TolC family protein [Pyrinomonadaceae bacterium]|nr:TolC family protein [Pyrinomonadaceae bacterium]